MKVSLGKILGRKKRSEDIFSNFDDDFMDENDFKEKDPSVEYYPSPYCNLIEGFEKACYEFSILELWAENGYYEDSIFDQLTTDEILDKINHVNHSGRFLVEKDFQSLLGKSFI